MFTYFYCLPIQTTLILFILGIAWWVVFRVHICKQFLKSNKGRIAIIVSLILWHVVILYLTIFSRNIGSREANLLPFYQIITVMNGGNPEILRTAWMNILLFTPLGVLYAETLPNTVSGHKKEWIVIILATSLSMGIEIIQWTFALGFAEIDDVMCNVFGTIIGMTVYYFIKKFEVLDP